MKTREIKAKEVYDIVLQKTHCDYIVKQAKELQALFSHHSESMIELNKIRALADIEAIRNSLTELEFYIKEL